MDKGASPERTAIKPDKISDEQAVHNLQEEWRVQSEDSKIKYSAL